MTNEILSFITIAVELVLILIAMRLGKEWLYVTIALNMVLITTLGIKTIEIFNLTTNAGNVFFASIFIATHLLVEHYGNKAGYKSIWIGFMAVVIFTLMSQITLRFGVVPGNETASSAIDQIFRGSARIALASLSGFLIVQHINVWLYDYLKRATSGKYLWLRDTSANFLGQLVDSVTFFSIAFYGVWSSSVLIQAMLAGFIIKVAVGVLGTAVMYASYFIKRKESGTGLVLDSDETQIESKIN